MSANALPIRVSPAWPMQPLSKITKTFSDGDWIESKDQSTAGMRLIQTGNIGEGEFRNKANKARFIDTATFTRLNCTEIFAGDVLISRLPEPVGRACVLPASNERMITAVDCTIVRLDDEVINPSFFVYFTQSETYLGSVADRCTGTTRSRISRTELGTIEIPLPPLDEQMRIVAVMDQAFAALARARANAEANLMDVRALFDAELRLQFEKASEGVKLIPFDSLCEALTPNVKLKRQDYLDDGAYPVVSQEAELVSGYWNDPSALIGAGEPVVVFGDHTCCLKHVDFDFVVGADGTKVLKPCKGISSEYLYYGLRNNPVEQDGYARHFKFLRERSLPDLPLDAQVRINARLKRTESDCDELARTYETKLADIAALRQSLLQSAFSGQLT